MLNLKCFYFFRARYTICEKLSFTNFSVSLMMWLENDFPVKFQPSEVLEESCSALRLYRQRKYFLNCQPWGSFVTITQKAPVLHPDHYFLQLYGRMITTISVKRDHWCHVLHSTVRIDIGHSVLQPFSDFWHVLLKCHKYSGVQNLPLPNNQSLPMALQRMPLETVVAYH